ncbi:MAG: hypothetical protein DBX49_01255 [Clostridia bacterium]|nr:MAG: hypothetical protein DBX49_01255 [Clostridia bacterium]
MAYYIGIDPGQSGALGIIAPDGIRLLKFDESAYIETLKPLEGTAAVCCLEHVGSMPKQGVTSTFNFGQNFGWIQGVLQALGIPFELVRPLKWKKEFSVTQDKNTSVAVCQRLFPEISLLPTPRCRKPDDNLAEALLMAEYARRKLGYRG